MIRNIIYFTILIALISYSNAQTTAYSTPSGSPLVELSNGQYSWVGDGLENLTLWRIDAYDNEKSTYLFDSGGQMHESSGFVDNVDQSGTSVGYDEDNGQIKIFEGSSDQFHRVKDVINDRIITDDAEVASGQSPTSNDYVDESWWFTSKELAETYLASLSTSSEEGNAAQSLLGERVVITSGGQTTAFYFTEEDVYDENSISEGSAYTYMPSGDSASLSITNDSGETTSYALSFSSNLSATGTRTDNYGQENIELEISDQISAPSNLTSFIYQTTMGDTFQLKTDSKAVFYVQSQSGKQIENISYTWTRTGPAVGKFVNSLDEETWLFFETNTTGAFHWEELESEESSDGSFTLSKIDPGFARSDLSGDIVRIGENHYFFDENGAVTITSASGATSSSTYAYIQTGSNAGILSVPAYDGDSEEDPHVWSLAFSYSKYGTVEENGEYFDIWANWSTKGWVWYDDLPWIYSSNQGDWLYQYLFVNESNETELIYHEPWSGTWKASADLNYTDQRIFDEPSPYWEDYDDFSGSELNTSKWGTIYVGGGIEPYVLNGKLVLSGEDGNASAPKVVKTGWSDFFEGNDGGQSWVYAKDSDIYGIEVDFVIPSSASSGSGLQAGIASLNPFSYASVELNADPSSQSLYSQGFGFYHLINGSEIETFDSTQRDTTHTLRTTLIDGQVQLSVDGEIKYEADAGTFITDMFFLNAFNDFQGQGLAFQLDADNVRVLRKKSYPKGWMWTEFYPWAYSYETGDWIYFELAKDTQGQPVMNYWDKQTNQWDIYEPCLAPLEQR